MTDTINDAKQYGQANMQASMQAFGDVTKNLQAVAMDMANYSKHSFEDSTQTFEKLLSAKSFDQVVEIQTSYAKRQHELFMQQLAKLGGVYSTAAKDAMKNTERAVQTTR
jgi:hypothetical protein